MSIVVNSNFTKNVVTITQMVRIGEVEFLLGSQWRWLQKKSTEKGGCKCKGLAWSYLITQDVEGQATSPVWMRDDFCIEETVIRPKVTRSMYLERRGDFVQENEEDTLQPNERTAGKAMADEFGYIQVNEGYLPIPSRTKVEGNSSVPNKNEA